MVDLSHQYEEIRDEVDSAVLGVLESGRFILGPEEKAFENEFAVYTGVEHGIGVASGTDALLLVMRALGLGAGDEVLTTTCSFIATADSIARCGATPVLADIEPLTFNLDPDSMLERLTPRTKAIIAVHLFGHPADMVRISEIAGSRDIFLIEDCAQAHGATLNGRKVGTFGTAAAFSFFPTKPLGGAGDVYDRYRVRMAEMPQSLRIVEQALDRLPGGPVQSANRKFVPPPRSELGQSMESLIHHFKLWTEGFDAPRGAVYSAVESPRGELGVYLEGNGGPKAQRVYWRTPSFMNISALPILAKGHLVADLVGIIGSLDIVLGDVDR